MVEITYYFRCVIIILIINAYSSGEAHKKHCISENQCISSYSSIISDILTELHENTLFPIGITSLLTISKKGLVLKM